MDEEIDVEKISDFMVETLQRLFPDDLETQEFLLKAMSTKHVEDSICYYKKGIVPNDGYVSIEQFVVLTANSFMIGAAKMKEKIESK